MSTPKGEFLTTESQDLLQTIATAQENIFGDTELPLYIPELIMWSVVADPELYQRAKGVEVLSDGQIRVQETLKAAEKLKDTNPPLKEVYGP